MIICDVLTCFFTTDAHMNIDYNDVPIATILPENTNGDVVAIFLDMVLTAFILQI